MNCCLQIQRAEAHLGNKEYAIELWKIAFEIFEVTHGKDHPLLFKISREESHEEKTDFKSMKMIDKLQTTPQKETRKYA